MSGVNDQKPIEMGESGAAVEDFKKSERQVNFMRILDDHGILSI